MLDVHTGYRSISVMVEQDHSHTRSTAAVHLYILVFLYQINSPILSHTSPSYAMLLLEHHVVGYEGVCVRPDSPEETGLKPGLQ